MFGDIRIPFKRWDDDHQIKEYVSTTRGESLGRLALSGNLLLMVVLVLDTLSSLAPFRSHQLEL